MQSVQLQVDDEIKAMGDALKSLIVDIKAKKSVAVIAADALPNLIAAAAGFANFTADIKKPDDEAYLAKCIAEALNA